MVIPSMEEISEASNIAPFAPSKNMISVKANDEMNMAMVNPIPQRNAAAISMFLVNVSGILAIPNFSNTKTKIRIPSGLPITKPNIIPIANGLAREDIVFSEKTNPAFASVNSGMITNATHGVRLCSNL